jgi:hypothetical protein
MNYYTRFNNNAQKMLNFQHIKGMLNFQHIKGMIGIRDVWD